VEGVGGQVKTGEVEEGKGFAGLSYDRGATDNATSENATRSDPNTNPRAKISTGIRDSRVFVGK